MIDLEEWHERILEAWRRKVEDMAIDPPKESTTRMQEAFRVTLLLWDDRHVWYVVDVQNGVVKGWARVGVDEPISQEAVFQWLAKTTPIE